MICLSANHVSCCCVQFGWADMLQKDCCRVWIHPKPCNTLLWKRPLQLTLWKTRRSSSMPRDMHSKTSPQSPRCHRSSQKSSPSQQWRSIMCRARLLSSISLSTPQHWSAMPRVHPLQPATAKVCQWMATPQPPHQLPCKSLQQHPSPHQPRQHHRSLSMAPPCKVFSLRKFTMQVPETELCQLRYGVFHSNSCPLFGSELPVSFVTLQVGFLKCFVGT